MRKSTSLLPSPRPERTPSSRSRDTRPRGRPRPPPSRAITPPTLARRGTARIGPSPSSSRRIRRIFFYPSPSTSSARARTRRGSS
eukprot:31038-Pelagococcus_subviridis.AAC.10